MKIKLLILILCYLSNLNAQPLPNTTDHHHLNPNHTIQNNQTTVISKKINKQQEFFDQQKAIRFKSLSKIDVNNDTQKMTEIYVSQPEKTNSAEKIPATWTDATYIKHISAYSRKFLSEVNDPEHKKKGMLIGKPIYIENNITFDENPQVFVESHPRLTSVDLVQKQYDTEEKENLWRKWLQGEFKQNYRDVAYGGQEDALNKVVNIYRNKSVPIMLHNDYAIAGPPPINNGLFDNLSKAFSGINPLSSLPNTNTNPINNNYNFITNRLNNLINYNKIVSQNNAYNNAFMVNRNDALLKNLINPIKPQVINKETIKDVSLSYISPSHPQPIALLKIKHNPLALVPNLPLSSIGRRVPNNNNNSQMALINQYNRIQMQRQLLRNSGPQGMNNFQMLTMPPLAQLQNQLRIGGVPNNNYFKDLNQYR